MHQSVAEFSQLGLTGLPSERTPLRISPVQRLPGQNHPAMDPTERSASKIKSKPAIYLLLPPKSDQYQVPWCTLRPSHIFSGLAGGPVSRGSDNAHDWYKHVEEHFKAHGLRDTVVTGSGGRWADVYAGNPETKSFALVECKTKKNCDSDEGVEYSYPERDFYLCDRRRRDMWTIVDSHLPPVLRPKRIAVRNFAVAVSHQLYCYFWDILDGQCRSKKVRERKWTCAWPPTFQATEPSLVVPLEYLDALDWVTHEFLRQTWLPQVKPAVQDDQRGIAVARIYYPVHKPRDRSKAC